VTLETISVEVSPRRVATVTLNRPDRGNSLNQTMMDELSGQFAALGTDEQVRVVVLRGSGRHFCTGADLASRGAGAPTPAETAKPPATLRDVLVALDTLPKPTIAVVHGGAIGGGAALPACCDIALATEAAFFSIPEIRVGMAPFGVTPFLIRAMGHRNFRRYGLSGERIAPPEALRIGLVHQVCDDASVDETLGRIIEDLLHGAPGALVELKSFAAQFASPTLSAIFAQSAPHNPRSPEAVEGIASFREKRKPSWYPQ
jgi:methylglutaconyl-CoA hydratase